MNNRVVIKVGTKVITSEDGQLNTTAIESIVSQISQIRTEGVEVVLVSSGAMGAGRGLLPPESQGNTIPDKQMLAAVGQVRLMSTYAEHFQRHGLLCAQVLVTKEDFRDKTHYFNMRNCLESLVDDRVVPVINENDVVAVSELIFTNNDELTGLVASMVGAERVIILTSVEGVLTGPPSDPASKLIPTITVEEIEEMQAHIQPEKSAFGRGGMLTKFGIAKKLALQGITTHIADGRVAGVLTDILKRGAIGTTFVPTSKAGPVKRRIAYSEGWEKGSVTVNTGAEEALRSREKVASLLMVGVTDVTGDFDEGDVVEIKNSQGVRIGFGTAAYTTEDARAVIGKKGVKPFIHYDYMFINS